MFKADNLVKTFYRTEQKGKKVEFNAVDGISVSISGNEILGILGPNGAGKTTLLRMLAGLMKPTSGAVSADKTATGYLSGNTRLYGRMSAREMLRLFGTIYEIPSEEIEHRIEEISDVLDMGSFIDNRIERLSTGQTQRVSIARTIIHNPELYIFDEPTLGLDIISSTAIIEFMKGEKERGKSVIYSTHYMEEAEYLCDRIIMISHGRAICNASPAELKQTTGAANMRDAFYRIIEKEGVTYED